MRCSRKFAVAFVLSRSWTSELDTPRTHPLATVRVWLATTPLFRESIDALAVGAGVSCRRLGSIPSAQPDLRLQPAAAGADTSRRG